MTGVDSGRFTIGVFQDVAWAQKGLAALSRQGIPVDAISVIAIASADVRALVEQTWSSPPRTLAIKGLGDAVAVGPLVSALPDLPELGLAATLRRVGFQAHDGRIYETLTARGGVLVAVHSEPRAADVLAVLHAYGGGNAAIGAWTGRL